MDTIKMASGLVFDCAYLATDGQGTAWIVLDGLDMAESAAVMSDPENTSEMEWGDFRLIGYTELAFMMNDPNVGVKCGLKGGHDERIRDTSAGTEGE